LPRNLLVCFRYFQRKVGEILNTIQTLVACIMMLIMLQACNLPSTELPEATNAGIIQDTNTPLISLTPRPPTSTPVPQVWFVGIEEGDILVADINQASNLPVVTTHIGFTNDQETGRSPRYIRLFGWTDIDQDGIIEILSDLPYGLQP
jgi:hypothetical protein